jgi:cell division protein FtsQ
LIVLLVAAIGRRNHERCKDYVISIDGAQKNLFINENDIRKLLNTNAGGKIKDKPIADFNLRTLEEQLEKNPWVRDANLYFDNQDVLHVTVLEKEPIARIFTSAGKSFYIDSSAKQMPLSTLMSARVPVFTNFPDKKFLSDKDSILLKDVKKTAWFILNDPFWMAQTEQVDIDDNRTFEMIPTVGNHIVRLGNGDDIDKKFHRLFVFYQQVLSKTGFEKYNVVDVQYAGQVIGTKEKISKVDSIQLKKSIEKLLEEERQMQQDTTIALPVTQQKETVDTQDISPGEKTEPGKIVHGQNNSIPKKTTSNAKPKIIENKTEEKKPKAVMPAKSN